MVGGTGMVPLVRGGDLPGPPPLLVLRGGGVPMKTNGHTPEDFRAFCSRHSLDPSWASDRGRFIRAVLATMVWADSKPSTPSSDMIRMKVRTRLNSRTRRSR